MRDCRLPYSDLWKKAAVQRTIPSGCIDCDILTFCPPNKKVNMSHFIQNYVKTPCLGIFKPRKAFHLMSDFTEYNSSKSILVVMIISAFFPFVTDFRSLGALTTVPMVFSLLIFALLCTAVVSKWIMFNLYAKLLYRLEGLRDMVLIKKGILLTNLSWNYSLAFVLVGSVIIRFLGPRETLSVGLQAIVLTIMAIYLLITFACLFTRLSLWSEVKQAKKRSLFLKILCIQLLLWTLLFISITLIFTASGGLVYLIDPSLLDAIL